MNDLMIDLETLGTGSNSVVLSIGACFFDVDTGEIGETFYTTLDIEDQIRAGRKIDASTLQWWVKQSADAQKVFFDEIRDADLALENFCTWVEMHAEDRLHPWGNGSMFDIGILESLLADFAKDVPWKFSNVMDLRTFRRFVAKGSNVIRIGTHHNALDDAISQATFVINTLKESK
jgi:3'-5' exoribonuclease-like protein